MKALFVANSFPPVRGGSPSVYVNLCRELAPQITVLAPSHECASSREIPGWRESDAQQPFEVRRLDFLRPPLRPSGGVCSSVWQWATMDGPLLWRMRRYVLELVRELRPDVVCFGEVFFFYWLYASVRRAGVPVVQYIHGEEITAMPRLRFYGRGMLPALRRCEQVIAVSRFTQGQLVHLGVDTSRITIIANGVDLVEFQPGPADPSLLEKYGLTGKQVLLTVARAERKKGQDQVIRALPEILSHCPAVRYVVVGTGTYLAELRALASFTGVEDKVVFTGLVPSEDLARFYRAADLFIMPNRTMPDGDTEGFGLVFLEAGACGKPVIGGRAGGVLDAVDDNETGLLVDGQSVEQIAAAVVRILSDPGLGERLGKAGLVKARNSSWRQKAVEFRDVCERISLEHSHPRRSASITAAGQSESQGATGR